MADQVEHPLMNPDLHEDEDDSDDDLFEEMLNERGPLVQVSPEAVKSSQLEQTLRHLWGAIKLNEKAIKRAKNAKKAQILAARKASIQVRAGPKVSQPMLPASNFSLPLPTHLACRPSWTSCLGRGLALLARQRWSRATSRL